ncbi:centromere protein C isoform X2 [Pantherophis guttatus]|uniref:Centromere protein C n=1 Tax=Pantherophis guttatus TaxID=94885 RepID=A0A6P9BWT9_PANGU|nr:centromere protein C isoform X2 [Pantherophis guttatus]
MDSLNHLKTAYRLRFFNREGKKIATGIQGESVLECVHNCFETCTKQSIECSSTISYDSSFNLNQVPCYSKEKEQTKLEFAKDNTFVSLRSPDKMEKFSGSKISEEIKENDAEVLCLGSPDLLVESGEEGQGEEGEKSCAEQLCFNEEGFYLSQKFSKSKGFSARKEMEELCIEEPASKQIKMSGPMFSLNSATLKPEEECEFLIEEFFDLSSASWISISGKKQKPQKKTTSASFEGNEEAKQHNERRKNKIKQSVTQKKKKRSPGRDLMGKKNRQLVSKGSLEDVHGEEHLDKKKNLHPFKLRTELKRATSQKVRETSLPKPQNNVLYQEDSCEQRMAKKHSNISVTPQNNEGSLSYDPLLLPLCSNEIFRKEWNPFNTDDSDSDKSSDLEKNLHRPISNSLKHKLILPTNTPNVRRSQRIRIKPLEYWRGERINYKINTSGDFVIGGIISPEQRESWKPKVKVAMKSVPENENLHDNSIFMEKIFQPAIVFDKASNQQILLECVHNGSSPVFCFSNEILSIYKYLSTPSFASGKIILNPLKEKGYQYSHTDTLVFHISCGKLLLMLYDQSYRLTTGNYFFIPPGNVYNIRNLLNEECVVLFTQLKGKELLDN